MKRAAINEKWMDEALCIQIDPDLFQPLHGGDHATRAKKICNQCPVRLPCAEYAIDDPELTGVWGGTTERERRRLRAIKERGLGLV